MACALPGLGAPPAPSRTPEPTPTELPPTTATTTAEARPAATTAASPTPGETASATPPTVTVRANGANLTLRRGPALAYDIVGYLAGGQETRASGRNASGVWLMVERPGAPGQFGWVFLGR